MTSFTEFVVATGQAELERQRGVGAAGQLAYGGIIARVGPVAAGCLLKEQRKSN